MAKIVYGVSGEGSGHSSRSREMLNHLQSKGHAVKVVSYDRGYANLKDDFDVFETEGLHIASLDNRVSKVKTFTDNLMRLPEGHKKLQSLRKDIFKKFQPDCVITDFEPMTAYLANHYDLPLITIDNQHRLRYMSYPCPARLHAERKMTKTIIWAMVPRPDVSLVTTFYYGEPKNERTFFFPPILRQEVLSLKHFCGEHILVYLTSGFETFLKRILSNSAGTCSATSKNIQFPFSETSKNKFGKKCFESVVARHSVLDGVSKVIIVFTASFFIGLQAVMTASKVH